MTGKNKSLGIERDMTLEDKVTKNVPSIPIPLSVLYDYQRFDRLAIEKRMKEYKNYHV
jgi:hypothetical protein